MPDQPGHEGHDHGPLPPFNRELFEKIMRDVADAVALDNLFLIPLLNPPRFVLTQVNDEGEITTLGYIPIKYMLDVGIGFVMAVKNAMESGMAGMEDHQAFADAADGDEPDAPLAGGVYKVL